MNRRLLIGLIAAVGVAILLGLIGTCRSDANSEMAVTARKSIELAQRASENNDSAYLWPGRMRLVALVIGITIPVAAAVAVLYLVLRHRPEELDLLAEVHRQEKLLGDPRQILPGQRIDPSKTGLSTKAGLDE